MESGNYPFVMCNLAPPDMVGHTGVYDATVQAVAACDRILGQIYEACKANDYILVITSDHGNCEEMLDAQVWPISLVCLYVVRWCDCFCYHVQGKPKTSHTSNPVFCIIAGTGVSDMELDREEGGMCDVSPTVLRLMGLPIPKEMTGTPLIR